MADVIQSIGTAGAGGGRTFSHPQAWWDLTPTDMATDGRRWIGELYNDGEFTIPGGQLLLSGRTTSATAYPILRCAAGQSFADHAGKLTNQQNYDQAKGVGFLFNTGFLLNHIVLTTARAVIEGVQVRCTYGSGGNIVRLDAASTAINKLLIRRENFANTAASVAMVNASSMAANVSTMEFAGNNGSGFSFDANAAVINCTALYIGTASTGRAFSNGYAAPLVRNCIGGGYAAFSRPGFALGAGSDYNASDLPLGTGAGNSQLATGAHNVGSIVLANTFEVIGTASTTDLRIKAGASVIGAGLRDAAYTADVDIVGKARSLTAPTIGAWEYAAAATGTNINPGAAAVVLTGYAPSIAQPKTVAPAVGALVLTGYAPSVSQSVSLAPSPATLALSGYAPAIGQPHGASPAKAQITLIGHAPTVSQAGGIVPGRATLALMGYAPTIGQPRTVNPAPAGLQLVGYPPTITRVPLAAANEYFTTIMRASTVTADAGQPSTDLAVDMPLVGSYSLTTIMRASSVSGTGAISSAPINLTASLQ